jgi:hypothetical protein
MMLWDKKRADWVFRSKAVVGPMFPPWANIEEIIIHYPGADWRDMDFNKDGTENYLDTATLLDNTNNFYWTDPARGYALGYNAGADIFGLRWEIRGDTYQCAANKNHNHRTFAILVIVDNGNEATLAQVDAVRDIVAQVWVLAGREIPINPHHSIGVTACPGPGLTRQIEEGVFLPRKSVPAPGLRFGMSGPRVRELRRHLHFWGHQEKIGRFYGRGTRAAVKRWQTALGVKPTGRYNVATATAYAKSVGLA